MSDRFFLNVVNSVTDSDNAKFLLDRSHYMRSLTEQDVLCVIMSSFGLNVESSQSEFLNLLGAESKVPTLIIHGDKRKSLAAASLLRKKTKSHRNKYSVGDSNTTTNGTVSGVSGNPGIVIKEERSAIVNEDGRSQKVTTEEFLSVLIKEEKLDVIIKQEKKLSFISEERSSSVIKREFVSTVVEKDAHTAKCNITNGAKSLLEDSPSKFQRPILQLHAHSDSDAHDVMTSTLLRCPESVYIERVKPQWSYPLKGIDNDRIENSAQVHQGEHCSKSSDKRSRPNSNTENDNTYSCTSSGTGSREGSSPCGIDSKANITLDNADRTGLNPECAAGSANRLGGSVSGVHHPKYILTFTSKGLHVMISTSNLTPQTSAEATWTDFFPLKVNTMNVESENDFGSVLQDFLKAQSDQISTQAGSGSEGPHDKDESTDPIRFMQKFVGCSDISSTYDFSRAQVDLVTSVPSRKPLEPPTAAAVLRMFRASDKKSKTKSYNRDLTFYSATVRPPCKRCVRDSQRLGLRVSVVAEQAHHSFETVGHSPYDSCDPMSQSSDSLVGCSIEVTGSRSPSILYGLQRCRQVLMRNAILLPRALDDGDVMVVQPTSISNGIDISYMGYFLSHFMPEEFWTDNYVTEGPLRIDSCRFIWPKLSFIRKCVSLSGYVKEGTTARIDKKITDTSVHHKGRTLGRRHSAPTGLYDSPAKQKTKQEVLKNFEKVRNSHEKPIKCPSASKKRNREVLYSDDEALAMSSEEEDAVGNSLYFRVKNLALMELDLQSRMYTYETNKAQAIRFVRNISPHIKSYTRLMTASNDVKTLARSPNAKPNTPDSCSTRMARQTGCGGGNNDTEGKGQDKGGPKDKEQKKGRDGLKGHLCNCHPVAWSLITSSCLSRGAHGVVVPHSICGGCRNIKHIGVLFHTRPGKSYRALSADCPVHSKGTKHKSTLSSEAGSHSIEGKGGTDTDIESDEADSIVVLPFPFEVQGGIPYYEETDSRFTHRPFLNGSDREVAIFGSQLNLPLESPMVHSDTQSSLELSQRSQDSFIDRLIPLTPEIKSETIR